MKYWYLLPPYAGLLLLSAGRIAARAAVGYLSWIDFLAPAICTAVFVAIWWLNEVIGVGRLRHEQARLLDKME